jgi:hypothetical protein
MHCHTAFQSSMNQEVDAEFYRLKRGCFRLDGCTNHSVSSKMIKFEKDSYLNDWMESTVMTATSTADDGDVDDVRPTTTIAIARDEYANLYHTASDWYNCFLMTKFFNINTERHVLFVDAHPSGPLDDVWNTLFGGGASRMSYFGPRSRILFKDLIWATPGHRGLFEQHFRQRLPLVEEFHRLVHSSRVKLANTGRSTISRSKHLIGHSVFMSVWWTALKVPIREE